MILYKSQQCNPDTRRRYGRAWKRIRDSYVKLHPFGELCYEIGVLVPTEEVHHKKPWVGIANTNQKLMMQAASEFGLTPSARSSIVAGNTKSKESRIFHVFKEFG